MNRRPFELLVAVLHAAFGWVMAAAATSLAMWKTPAPNAALSAHAVVVPVAFLLAATVYFRRPQAARPLVSAAVFAAVAIAMDLVVARAFGRPLDAHALLLGSLLPAASAFIATWLAGTIGPLTPSTGAHRA